MACGLYSVLGGIVLAWWADGVACESGLDAPATRQKCSPWDSALGARPFGKDGGISGLRGVNDRPARARATENDNLIRNGKAKINKWKFKGS
ncbi:hypothetical protein HOY82DRAFT_557339, partial [Tuber indicum]